MSLCFQCRVFSTAVLRSSCSVQRCYPILVVTLANRPLCAGCSHGWWTGGRLSAFMCPKLCDLCWGFLSFSLPLSSRLSLFLSLPSLPPLHFLLSLFSFFFLSYLTLCLHSVLIKGELDTYISDVSHKLEVNGSHPSLHLERSYQREVINYLGVEV